MKGHTQVYKLTEMFFHTFGWMTALCVMDHGLDYHGDNHYYCHICAGSLEYSGRYFQTKFCQRMMCARAQSMVHGWPLEITFSQHVDAQQLSLPPSSYSNDQS